MKIRLEHGLASVEATLAFRERSLRLSNKIPDFEIEVGAMDYGFPADGILGLDYPLRADSLIDLRHLELRLSDIR